MKSDHNNVQIEMIEYDEDKFGRIKVLNVTEARAHFSTLLKDGANYYVITKNNKPIRAVISFADFSALKGFVESGQYQPAVVERPSDEEMSIQYRHRPSRVRGMLFENDELAEQTAHKSPAPGLPPKKTKAADKRQVSQEKIAQEKISQEETAQGKKTAALPQTTVKKAARGGVHRTEDSDYFLEPAESSVNLLSPEETEIFAGEPKPQTQAQVVPPVVAEKAAEKKPAEPTQDKASKEEEEYLNKYRKLYERFEDNVPGVDSKTGDGEKDYFTSSVGDFTFSEEDLSKNVSQEVPAEKEGKGSAAGDNELPSLKDLLTELEAEKISGEDEEMDDREIDELIHRITSD